MVVVEDVRVMGHLSWERGGCVADIKGHGVIISDVRPLCGGEAVDYGLAGAVVGCDVSLNAGEVGGELRWVLPCEDILSSRETVT